MKRPLFDEKGRYKDASICIAGMGRFVPDMFEDRMPWWMINRRSRTLFFAREYKHLMDRAYSYFNEMIWRYFGTRFNLITTHGCNATNINVLPVRLKILGKECYCNMSSRDISLLDIAPERDLILVLRFVVVTRRSHSPAYSLSCYPWGEAVLSIRYGTPAGPSLERFTEICEYYEDMLPEGIRFQIEKLDRVRVYESHEEMVENIDEALREIATIVTACRISGQSVR